MGRPKGSGAKPAVKVRKHRVTIMLNDAELRGLKRIATREESPLATSAYRLLMKSMGNH